MKNQTYAIYIYAILLLVGGIIGFIKAGSLISLGISGVFSFWLMGCAYGLQKNCMASYLAAVSTLIILTAFFTYRYFTTQHFMPGGLMALLTIGFLGYLYTYKNSCQSTCSNSEKL